jgi:aquaporin rerated protein, other eukaryote
MDFASHHWIYWAGPYSGSMLAAGLYKLLKILEFEKANPGQDANTVDASNSDEGQVRI